MNFLDGAGLGTVWNRVVQVINKSIHDITKLKGKPSGYASLDSAGKLEATQLPTIKTVNGQSIIGSGNITLDLSLYKIVDELPTENIETGKIYLKKNGDVYTQYIYKDNSWEVVGDINQSIDLHEYVKTTDVATSSKDGLMTSEQFEKLNGLEKDTPLSNMQIMAICTLG